MLTPYVASNDLASNTGKFDDHLNSLISYAEEWKSFNEDIERRSNGYLYPILQEIYRIGWMIETKSQYAEELSYSLNHHFKQKEMTFHKDTHLMVRLCALVFGREQKNRYSAYGTALKNLLIQNVEPASFIKAITDAGGTEGARRLNSKNNSTDFLELDKLACNTSKLASIESPELSKRLDHTAKYSTVILIATTENDGSVSIHRVIQKESSVKKVLKSIERAVSLETSILQEQSDRNSKEENREAAIQFSSGEAA